MPASSLTAVMDNEPKAETLTTEIGDSDTTEILESDTTQSDASDITEVGESDTTQSDASDITEVGESDTTQSDASDITEVGESDTTQSDASDITEVGESDTTEDEADLLDDKTMFEQALGRNIRVFKENELVEGTVVSVDIEGALVDIGFKSEALIPAAELSIRKNVDPRNIVSVGETVEGVVLTREDENGRPILSMKRAQYKRAWTKVEEVHKDGKSVKGTVIEVVKGGLIVDIGLRGFLPASLVGLRRVCNLHPFIDTEIEAKVIELDRQRNNVVLSRRAFLEEEQAEERDGFMNRLVEGEVREGTVSSVVPFGAFVDLGKMDGLVHVSELAWTHISHPSEVVEVGATVTVKVLEVDRERERISLSIRQTLEDPWSLFSQANEVGSIIDGKVTKTVPFGAFVAIADGVEGLVHVSEIAMHRVESPEMELSIGQDIKVKITELDTNRRRVSLSMKQALSEWKDAGQAARPRPRREERPRPPREEPETERRSVRVDSSLEAILEELKKRGIGGR